MHPVQLFKIVAAKIFHIEYSYPQVLDTVIFNVRLPRIIGAMLVGGSLSIAGVTYQGMFKNPMVSPDVLGASAGAGFGAAIAIYFSFGFVGIQITSFAFSLLAVFISCFISGKIKHDPILSLVLSGIMIGGLFTSAIGIIKYIGDPYDKLPAITFWLMGSLSSITTNDINMVILPIVLSGITLHLIRWRLNVLALGEEEAKTLGLDTKKIRIIAIICSTVMTAASISISGIIGWIGLVIPHFSRMIVGPNYKVLLPTCAVVGSTYLLIVDDLARLITTTEIPLGILTTIIGIPFFLYLLLHNNCGWH